MTKKAKKVLFFIVEGTTDMYSLKKILQKIFQNDEVFFQIVHGDITTRTDINKSNVKNFMSNFVKIELKKYGFNANDIIQYIHLTDTDGAFIPEDKIIKAADGKIDYEEDCIKTVNVNYIIKRNRQKKIVTNLLVDIDSVQYRPYHIYYLSRNLEHVLHNLQTNLSMYEKTQLAMDFANNTTPEDFLDLINAKHIAVEGNYLESWDYIETNTNSLKRKTNMHLIF